MSSRLILSLLLIGLLLIPSVHAQKALNIDYAPRVGKTLYYDGRLVVLAYNETDGLTHNYTFVVDFSVKIVSYSELSESYTATLSYNYTIDFYLDGMYLLTRHDAYTTSVSGSVYIGLMDEDNMIFLALNMSYVYESLYLYTLELTPENFTARIVDTDMGTGLKINAYLSDEDEGYAEIHVTYLLDYGIMYSESIYFKPAENESEISLMEFSDVQEARVEYKLKDFETMDKIPKILDYPDERNTLEAERRVYNETDNGYAGIDVNRIVVVGEIILFDVDVYVRTQTIALMRTSTFGRMPSIDSPRAMPPVLVYPPYLDAIAHEENASISTFTVEGKSYTVYVFSEDDSEIAFIEDLGLLAYAHNANNTAGVELTHLSYESSSGGEEGGESGGSTGGIGGLSSNQLALAVVLVIAVVLLSILVYILKRG